MKIKECPRLNTKSLDIIGLNIKTATIRNLRCISATCTNEQYAKNVEYHLSAHNKVIKNIVELDNWMAFGRHYPKDKEND